MKKLLRWLDEHSEETILSFFLVLVTFIVLFQVIMRYIVKAAEPWPEEFSRYCFVCSTMLSIGYCIRKAAMLRVDTFVKMMPRTAQRIIEVLILILSLVLYSFLFYHSFSVVEIARNSKQLSPAMQLPMFILYVFAPVGFGLAAVRTVQEMVRTINGWVKEAAAQEPSA
jgi:C4-dicarboxylate transporter DctQ subunit